MSAFIDGLVAGYAIAVPLGAISVLIIGEAIENGFHTGFGAGVGVATVDAICATLVVFAGLLVSSLLVPIAAPLAILGGAVLVLMGAYGLLKAWSSRKKETMSGVSSKKSGWKTYFQYIGLTIVNPFTAIYFLALIMGGSTAWITSTVDCAMFVVGVTFASLSWQTLLAGVGAFARKHLSTRLRLGTMLVGNAIVVLLGLNLILT